jgi:plasmid stability protein
VATLYIRNVPVELYDKVKAWAAASGRSVNGEILQLIEVEADRRRANEAWYADLIALRKELGWTKEDAQFGIDVIRAARDAGES